MKADCRLPGAQGRGRRMDATLDAAILQAALEGLAEVGYDRLTMEMIAARAHTGKGALYRRWSSKAELVIQAIKARHRTFEPADTGSLRGDLDAMLTAAPGLEVDGLMHSVFAGLVTAVSRDPELAAVFHREVVESRKSVLREVLERAVTRGEIPPERDIELILNVVPAFICSWGVLNPDAVSGGLFRRLITEIVYPLLVAPASAEWEPGS